MVLINDFKVVYVFGGNIYVFIIGGGIYKKYRLGFNECFVFFSDFVKLLIYINFLKS